jgi:hypothetical protein
MNNDNDVKMDYSGIIGWLGTCLILIAYLLENIEFQYKLLIICFNLAGSMSVGYICYLQKVWQAFFLEFCWFGVSLYSFIKYVL